MGRCRTWELAGARRALAFGPPAPRAGARGSARGHKARHAGQIAARSACRSLRSFRSPDGSPHARALRQLREEGARVPRGAGSVIWSQARKPTIRSRSCCPTWITTKEFLLNKVTRIEGVSGVRSSFVMRRVIDTTASCHSGISRRPRRSSRTTGAEPRLHRKWHMAPLVADWVKEPDVDGSERSDRAGGPDRWHAKQASGPGGTGPGASTDPATAGEARRAAADLVTGAELPSPGGWSRLKKRRLHSLASSRVPARPLHMNHAALPIRRQVDRSFNAFGSGAFGSRPSSSLMRLAPCSHCWWAMRIWKSRASAGVIGG